MFGDFIEDILRGLKRSGNNVVQRNIGGNNVVQVGGKTFRSSGNLTVINGVVVDGDGDSLVEQTRTDTKSGNLAMDACVKVSNVNGSITVQTWNKSQFKWVAHISAWGKDEAAAQKKLARLSVECDVITAHALILKAKHPSSTVNNDSIAFELWVPNGVTVELESVNGKIIADGFKGGYAETTNGKIKASHVLGNFKAETTNGKIDLSHMRGDVNARSNSGGISIACAKLGRIEAVTTNGGIKCAVPYGFAGKVSMRTRNGRLKCAFPVMGTIESRRIEGNVGEGANAFIAKTTNGSISFSKSL